MLINLNESFLKLSKVEIDSFFEKAFSLNIETKEDFNDLFESYVQLDSLVETYGDLGGAVSDYSEQLTRIEKTIHFEIPKFSFTKHELSKIAVYTDIENVDEKRAKLFRNYEESLSRFEFSFRKALDNFYVDRDLVHFKGMSLISNDDAHGKAIIEILKNRQNVFKKNIFEVALDRLLKLTDEDFLAPIGDAPSIKYEDVISKVLSVFEDIWNIKITIDGELLKLEEFGFIYLDPYQRDGKFDRPWTQVLQRGDGNGRAAICVVGFSFHDLISPDDLRSLFHELGHAFHHILNPDQSFFRSGMNSLTSDKLEYPSIFMERYLLDRGRFLELWNNEEAYAFLESSYVALLNKTIFMTFLDQVIHMKKYETFVDLKEEVDKYVAHLNFTIPYLNGDCAAIFSHAFEDDMYAGNYYWYLQADLWCESRQNCREIPINW